MFSVAAWHLVCIWSLKVRLESRCPPKYWTFFDLFDWFSYDIYGDAGALVELLPASKVDEFSLCFVQFEFTASIQALMSCMDFSMMAMVLLSGGVLLALLVLIVSGLKILLIEWSSAKPLRVNESDTILDSVKT